LMRQLKERGVGIIFITHFLEQVYEISDRITVLRNGKLVGEYETSALSQFELIAKMLGNELEDISKLKKHEPVASDSTTPVFECIGLSSSKGVRPFNFTIQKGEVNGFAGLLGSGRSESVRAIFAADKVTGGEVKIHGKRVKIKTPLQAIQHGIGYLPEDRKDDGIIADLSVRDNIILTLQVMKGFFKPLSLKQAQAFAQEYIEKLNIKTPTPNTPIKSLSGGNQQKVILARWLLTHPEYLILDEPTRGIDVGTKVEIQKLVLKLASEGMSLTFISSEIDEMLRTCSHLIVMKDRQIVAQLRGTELTENDVMNVIAQGGKNTCAK
ncbi:MAG: sugar ABC transporter ATP-binding protein, partial [Sphaerochaeta sp.]